MKSRSQFVRTALLAVAVAAVAGAGGVRAQQADAPKPPPLASQAVRLDVTVSRYQGDKKVSSLPFSLFAAAGSNMRSVSTRMGLQVPIGYNTTTDSKTETKTVSTQYRDVGTNIDCQVSRADETHWSIGVTVNDSSIYNESGEAKSVRPGDLNPVIRSLSTNGSVIMRDGQTLLCGTAADKISGEVIKVEITLTVVK